MKKKLRAVIYCRVASEDQFAIDKQKSILELYCEIKGYELCKVYSDNGYSVNGFRPDYDLMLRELKQDKFDIIITLNMARLNRSLNRLLDFMDLLLDNNCKLEVLDTTTNTISNIFSYLRMIRNVPIYLRFSTEEKANAFFGLESRGVR